MPFWIDEHSKLRSKNPTDIHSALREVCGEQTQHHSTDSRWATHFHDGCVSINNGQRRKTSTGELSVKLVVDFLQEDHQVMCEEISQATRIPPTLVFHILTNDLQKMKICARWVPHCLLLNRSRNASTLQHYWKKDLMLKVNIPISNWW